MMSKFSTQLVMLTICMVCNSLTALAADIPAAKVRRDDRRTYSCLDEVPRMEIVNEGAGTANSPYFDYLPDSDLKKRIRAGEFISLQVRDFCVKPNRGLITNNSLTLPFYVSVKHAMRPISWSGEWINGRQGTIDVEGWMEIVVSNNRVASVRILKIEDSSVLEALGRKVGNMNGIDTEFAGSVVVPVLTRYFVANPQVAGRIVQVFEESPERFRSRQAPLP